MNSGVRVIPVLLFVSFSLKMITPAQWLAEWLSCCIMGDEETTTEIRSIMLVTVGGALTLSLSGSSLCEEEIDGKFQEGHDYDL